MASEDLFVWIDSLWSKRKLEGTFPFFVAHRFLASDQTLAEAARVLWRDVRDPNMICQTWKGLLPKAHTAPRGLSYTAPKKSVAAEELTARMVAVVGERRLVVEEMQRIVAAAGRELDLYLEFGIEPPESLMEKALDEKRPRRRKKDEPPPDGGLLGQIA